MKFLICLMWMAGFWSVCAQTPVKSATPSPAPIIAYGTPISFEYAKKILASAETFAINKQYTVAIAIVDNGSNLVAFSRMDNTQIGSIDVAIGKAKTANNFKRPSKVFEETVTNGGVGLRVLTLPVYAIEGGEPIFSADGKIIGAIGVSGMTSGQDVEVVKAALAGIK